ncbi:MAG TPA: hypothetical protein VEP48_08585 [Methylomirabilota bacterium]|nr:hypothetical protein [Methylomirabilota bacterium]
MRQTTSSVLIGILIVLGLLLAFGGLALATLPPEPPDFPPFTMRITTWTAAAIQREGQAPQPGTLGRVLVYHGRDNWSVTVVDSTWDRSMVGTRTERSNGTHSTFVSQAQRIFSQVIGQDDASRRMAPVPWVYPGLFDGLSQSSDYQRLSNTAPGTATFLHRESLTNTRADGTLEVITGTVLVFDVSSGLPLSVQKYGDAVLIDSAAYEVSSRP